MNNLYKIQLSWNDVLPCKRRKRASKKDTKPKLDKLSKADIRKLAEPYSVERAMELRSKLV
jgi:hypothetical protein